MFSFENRLRMDFEHIKQKEDETMESTLKVTSQMFRTVFVAVKKNIPLSTHSSLVALQELHGIKMGFHHNNRDGATAIMSSISEYMHQQLIDYMYYNDLPFSIILDGSTDITNSHYLIIYFQILENNSPSVVFYKLVETTSVVTAKGYFETIKNSFYEENVDFYAYFKKNLVGYISDGESTMAGREGGLISFIRKQTKHPIYAVHCMAHRMHLAIEKSYASISYFATFDKLINKLFQFYNRNSSKKKKHLKETAVKLNLKFYELNYIYRARWIASELQSVKNLMKSWLLIVNDLYLIMNDNQNFDRDSRDNAHELLSKIKGKNFLAIVQFISDVLEHLSFWSRKMQQRTALLVDFVEFNDQIEKTFLDLKNVNGKNLNIFLENTICDGQKCEIIGNYYDAEEVKYLDVLLLNDRNSNSEDEEVPFIGEFREKFLDAIKNFIKKFFPSSELKVFKIFRPSDLPQYVASSLSFGVTEISNLCKIFELGACEELVEDWAKLLESIIESDTFCPMRADKTETFAFWAHYLNKVGIRWTPRTIELIQTILVLPIGSADAERGFSVMNHIKSEHRNRLSGKHLQDMIRIRLNANDDLDKFAAIKYAKKWVNDKHLRSDDPRQQRHGNSKSLLNEDELTKKYFPKLSFL